MIFTVILSFSLVCVCVRLLKVQRKDKTKRLIITVILKDHIKNPPKNTKIALKHKFWFLCVNYIFFRGIFVFIRGTSFGTFLYFLGIFF